jgi:hypothetical protein
MIKLAFNLLQAVYSHETIRALCLLTTQIVHAKHPAVFGAYFMKETTPSLLTIHFANRSHASPMR